jgi:hypothetical protein
MSIIPVAEYTPDQPDLTTSGSSTIKNVLPRTAASYGPFPSLTVLSNALTARCQGAYTMQDTAGNGNVFAGDASKLYKLPAGTTTFSNVSKVGGYTTGTTERWSFALFGQRVIATNFTDPIQSFVVGSSSAFADLSASAPKARYAAVIKDWLMAGNTTDGTYGAQPQRVWWPAATDPTNWPTPGTSSAAAVQSDFQDLYGEGGWVQGIVGNLGTADGAVFQERAVVRVTYVGPPAIFNFQAAEGARGTPAPGSIAPLGSVVHYLGEDGFYAFDGSNSQPTGLNKVDKTFFADLDQSAFHLISAAVDPINKIVLWAYPGAGHNGQSCNRILAYNWALQRWSITEAAALEIEFLFRSLSLGYSIDSLDNVSGSIDSLTDSLDSRIWTGGRILLSAFDRDHKMNYFTGANLAPTVDTSEGQIIAGQRATVLRVRPLVDGGTPSVSVGTRETQAATTSFGSAATAVSNGSVPVRASGRYHTIRLTLPAGSSFTHISGVDAEEVVPAGNR